MAWGLIVRCDQGGIGNQTRALWRELKPDKTLLVRTENPRGDEHPEDYDGRVIMAPRANYISEAVAGDFADGLNRIVSVEGFYGKAFDRLSVTTTVVANPELYRFEDSRMDEIILPTAWERERMPKDATVIPHPVTFSRYMYQPRESARTILHHWAPAMLDRNGTEALLTSLRYVKEPVRLIIRAPGRRSPFGASSWVEGLVSVVWDDSRTRFWDEAYACEPDVVVIPRRYGGLCLPAQEAAAGGFPVLMTDLTPQRWWPVMTCAVARPSSYMMKGGVFHIHEPDVHDLAAKITDLAAGRIDLPEQSRRMKAWARSISWPVLRDKWVQACAST